MNLRPDFVKHLSKQIKEAERRELALIKTGSKNKVIPRASVKNNFIGSNGTPPIITEPIKREQTFFDLLATNTGLTQFLFWVLQKCRAADLISLNNQFEANSEKDSTTSEYQKIDCLLEGLSLDEYRLMNLFTYIYLEVYEYKIYELFEIYELKPNMKLHCKQFYLIVVFTSAFESNQMLEFFFIFGKILFAILSGNRTAVYGVRLRQFAKLIGFPERILFRTFSELGIKESIEYEFDTFELLFFALFEEKEMTNNPLDRANSQEKILTTGGRSLPGSTDPRVVKHKKESKYKTCKGLCTIF